MYEQVFNLTSRPFTSTPYVKHYFPARSINGSLEQCKSIIDRGAGPVVVVGDHGTGKTMLLALLEDRYQAEYRVVNLSCSMMQSRLELLQSILFEVKQDYRGLSESEMRLGLIEFVKTNEASGAGILLLLDDAQKLTRDTIEELQLLTNFIRDGQPRVRLVIAGSQGLEDRLTDSCLESFNQRVAGRCFLECLDRGEVESYVRAHIENAGGAPDQIFDKEAYRAICDVSDGRPRFINQVCDHAMIFSATRGTSPVSDSLIREAWMDVQQLPGSVGPPTASMSAPASGSGSAPLIEESDGWTVLEFGELEEESPAASSDEVTQTELAVSVPEPIELIDDGPRFTVTPLPPELVAETVEQLVPTVDVEDQSVESEPTLENGAAILASAMSGFVEPGIEDSFPTEMAAAEPIEGGPNNAVPVEVNSGSFEDVSQLETVEEEPLGQESVAADPFADDGFEDEEVLTDTYSPFVAQQNQRSLNVTTDQLRDLTPHDMEQADLQSVYDDVDEVGDASDGAAIAGLESNSEEAFPTFDSAMQADGPVREPVKRQYEQREELETRYERDSVEQDSFDEDFSIKNGGAMLADENVEDSTQENPSVEISPLASESNEADMGRGFVPLDPDAPMVGESFTETPNAEVDSVLAEANEGAAEPFTVSFENEASNESFDSAVATGQSIEVETLSVVEETITPEISEHADAASPTAGLSAYLPPNAVPVNAEQPADAAKKESFHEQTQAPNDPEISRMAADIIRSLSTDSKDALDSVSHETGVVNVQDETAAIENTIQRTLEQRGDQEESAHATPSVVMPQAQQVAADESPVAHVPPVQPLSVHEAFPSATSQESAILNEIRDQSAIVAEDSSQHRASSENHDDRDILNVSANVDHVSQEAAVEDENAGLPEWSQAEPSTGEANRVDYQQLFNQLRNINPDE